MPSFLEALHSDRVLLMDAAMGTELQKAGLQPGEMGEEWNLLHPERVRAVHRAYVEAGAELLLTNTFQANRTALERTASRSSLANLIEAAIELAREQGRWVVGDIGPFDDDSSKTDRYGCTEIVSPMKSCDAILVETISDCPPLLRVLKQLNFPMPVLASATYWRDENGIRTISGLSPERWVRQVEKLSGVVAVGVNCGREIGMKECVEIVQRYRDCSHLPVFVRPNAGTPLFQNERWVYPHSPEYMASWLTELLRAGVRMIGGCCGTTPVHIAAVRKVIDEWNAARG